MYAVELGDQAKRFFEDSDASLQRRLDRCFDALKVDPRGRNNSKPLHGRLRGFWRYRVGDYRVIYQIDDSSRQVAVVAIIHRREAYE